MGDYAKVIPQAVSNGIAYIVLREYAVNPDELTLAFGPVNHQKPCVLYLIRVALVILCFHASNFLTISTSTSAFIRLVGGFSS